MNINEDDLHNLRHMTGANNPDKRKHGNRNYFAAGHGEQSESMQRLELCGLVIKGHESKDLTWYHATQKGCEHIGLHKSAIKRALTNT